MARIAPSWMKMSNVLAASPVSTQPVAREDEVPGGRHGDELGHALDQAEQRGLEQRLTAIGTAQRRARPATTSS